ncbi:MAG: hypothetical protein MJZ21_03615 [archaeon]|nr:hypothetical protein [archaeon]
MALFGFRRHKNRYLPGGRRERHDLVMRVHREVSCNDDVRNMNTLNLLLEQIDGVRSRVIEDDGRPHIILKTLARSSAR